VSVHVSSWAWKQPVKNPTAKLVLLKLADAANDDGICWPFQKTIAEQIGITDRQVRTHLNALAAAGLISIEQHYREDGGKSYCVYEVIGYTHRKSASGTPEASDPGHRKHASALARATVRKTLEPEPSIEPDPHSPPTPKTVDRKPVTDDEKRMAIAILLEFNDAFDSRFTIGAWMGKLVMRIREHPEMTKADHRRVIEANRASPWWRGAATPSVIYGSAAQFERSIATTTIGPGSGRISAEAAKQIADEEVEQMRREREAEDVIDVEAEEVDE